MKNKISSFFVIMSQVSLIVFFFVVAFNEDVQLEKHVSIIHNENLHKIATSVSLLFNMEEDHLNSVDSYGNNEQLIFEDLPSSDTDIDADNESLNEEQDVKSEIKYMPLVSVDSAKYDSNDAMGFEVTENNKTYTLSDYEFDVVVAVVAGEFDKNLNDALAVVSVILNRCDSAKWSTWAGSNPYSQVIRAGQFEVYFAGLYLSYMPGGSNYGNEKYNIAKQAVTDGINGIRNNEYLGFRAWHVSGYSDKYIVYGGNRYGYN